MKSLDYVSLAPNITFQSDDPKSVCLMMMKQVDNHLKFEESSKEE
jgi:hypothetical protein